MLVIAVVILAVGILAWILRPRREASRSRKYASLFVAGPLFLLAVLAIVFQLAHNSAGNISVADSSNWLFVAGILSVAGALIASAVLALARLTEVSKGMAFGACISVAVSVVELGLLEWLGGV